MDGQLANLCEFQITLGKDQIYEEHVAAPHATLSEFRKSTHKTLRILRVYGGELCSAIRDKGMVSQILNMTVEGPE